MSLSANHTPSYIIFRLNIIQPGFLAARPSLWLRGLPRFVTLQIQGYASDHEATDASDGPDNGQDYFDGRLAVGAV
jgi:hypothetical protein